MAQIVDPVFRGLYYGEPDDGLYWSEYSCSSLDDALYDLTEADDNRVRQGLTQRSPMSGKNGQSGLSAFESFSGQSGRSLTMSAMAAIDRGCVKTR